jgi:hypothetical protein
MPAPRLIGGADFDSMSAFPGCSAAAEGHTCPQHGAGFIALMRASPCLPFSTRTFSRTIPAPGDYRGYAGGDSNAIRVFEECAGRVICRSGSGLTGWPTSHPCRTYVGSGRIGSRSCSNQIDELTFGKSSRRSRLHSMASAGQAIRRLRMASARPISPAGDPPSTV